MIEDAKLTSDCLCIKTRQASNFLTKKYNKALEAYDLTITQYSLLSKLRHLGICTTSEWATHVNLDRTTLVRNIKPLFQKGYIEDLSSESSRNRQIQLTDLGFSILTKSRACWKQTQLEIIDKLGIEDYETLLRILDKLENIF